MTAARAENRQVTRVFYPVVDGELLQLPNGTNAVLEVGEPGYQLSSGELIPL